MEKGTGEWAGGNGRKEILDRFFRGLSAEQRSGIEAVGLDMWGPYIASIREHVPRVEGKLVFETFHIVGHMNGRSTTSGSESAVSYRRGKEPAERHSVLVALRLGEPAGEAPGGRMRSRRCSGAPGLMTH